MECMWYGYKWMICALPWLLILKVFVLVEIFRGITRIFKFVKDFKISSVQWRKENFCHPRKIHTKQVTRKTARLSRPSNMYTKTKAISHENHKILLHKAWSIINAIQHTNIFLILLTIHDLFSDKICRDFFGCCPTQ